MSANFDAAFVATASGALVSLLGVVLSGYASTRSRRERHRLFISMSGSPTSVNQHLSPPPATSGTPPKPTLADLEARVDAVEALFPPDSEIDKYATVNDALLDSGLSHLRARVIAIEAQLLSRWDIALVVFGILGALSVLTGVVFGIASYVKPDDVPLPTPTPTLTP